MTEEQILEIWDKVQNSPEDGEVALDNLLVTLREVEDVIAVDLPDSVSSWKRDAKQDVMHGIDSARTGIVAHYDEDEAKKDRQKLITVQEACLALYMAEDDMLATQVQSPSDSFLAPFAQIWKTVSWLIEHRKMVWRIIKQARPPKETTIGILVAVVLIACALIAIINASLVAGGFAASAARMMKARNFHVDWLRERALKQNQKAHRYVRSRRAR